MIVYTLYSFSYTGTRHAMRLNIAGCRVATLSPCLSQRGECAMVPKTQGRALRSHEAPGHSDRIAFFDEWHRNCIDGEAVQGINPAQAGTAQHMPLFYLRKEIMADQRKLLVVDDEDVVCQACRRIFSRQGFRGRNQYRREAGHRQGDGERLRHHPPGHEDAAPGWNPVPPAPPREETGRSGADHHRLSQHPERGRGNAPRCLRLRDQAVYLRGGHVGRATGAEHAARAQRRG